MDGIQGKTAVVIGASSGIGLATARLFCDEGAMVHAAARREAAILEGVGEERASSRRFVTHALDAADRSAVETVIGGIGEEGVDVLVYAAGINVPGRGFERLDPEDWEGMISTNLSGAYYALRAAFEPLRASRGLVILIGSVSGKWPDPSGAAYQASKMGLLGLARAVGFEEHQGGVRVSAILPGIVNTPILDNRPSPPDAMTREASLDPEDVAGACLFLATLPPRAYVPELTILPTRLQALGKTSTASPPLPEESEESEGGAPA